MDDVRRILLAFVLLGFPSSALAQGFTPVPDVPPKASLITISTPDSSNIVVGLRGRYNERADFLVTTTSPVNEGGIAPTSELLFPHLADWGAIQANLSCSVERRTRRQVGRQIAAS
jgi:hypothetical protein